MLDIVFCRREQPDWVIGLSFLAARHPHINMLQRRFNSPYPRERRHRYGIVRLSIVLWIFEVMMLIRLIVILFEKMTVNWRQTYNISNLFYLARDLPTHLHYCLSL